MNTSCLADAFAGAELTRRLLGVAQLLLASGVPVVGAGFELSSPLSMGPEHLAAV